MKSLYLIVQKLWPRLKVCHRVTDRQTDRTKTRCPRISFHGHKNTLRSAQMKHNIYKHKTQSLIYQVRSHYCVAGLMRTRKVQSKPRSVLQSEPIQRPAQQKVTSTPSGNAPNVLQAAKVLKPFFLQVANLKVEKSYFILSAKAKHIRFV